MNKKYVPLLFGLVPAIVLLLFLGSKLYTVSTGEEILLDTAPVDPRDLFRGDYVILSYSISTIDNETLGDMQFERQENIYASLSKKEKFWTVDSVSKTKPSLNENQVCLKGEIIQSRSNRVSATWGIESYFVPEGEGRPIERSRQNLSVIVVVDSSCNAIVKDLLINDTIVKFD